jgi:hypothetical protein
MTIVQRLRGLLTTDPHIAALCASGITFDSPPATVAEQMIADWEGATVRDPVLRESLERIAVRAHQTGVSWLYVFHDESGVAANDEGVFVL